MVLTKAYADKLLEKYSKCPICNGVEIGIIEKENSIEITCNNREKHNGKPHIMAVLGKKNQ